MPFEDRRNDRVQLIKSHSEFSKLKSNRVERKDRQTFANQQSESFARARRLALSPSVVPKITLNDPAVRRYLGHLWLFKQQIEFVYLEYFLQPDVCIFPPIYGFLEEVYKLLKCSPLVVYAVSALEDAWNYGFFLPLTRMIKVKTRTPRERWRLAECHLQLLLLWESWLNTVCRLQYLQFGIRDFSDVLQKHWRDGPAILSCRRVLTTMDKRCALALDRPQDACYHSIFEMALDQFLLSCMPETLCRVHESQIPPHWITLEIHPLILPHSYVYPERKSITFLKKKKKV